MPELPEITVLARQMNEALPGKTIAAVEVIQPKCLNVPVEAFEAGMVGAQVREVTHHGKWLIAETSQGWFLLNLGRGGEALLCTQETLPEKCQVILDSEDGTWLAIHFWWSGKTEIGSELIFRRSQVPLPAQGQANPVPGT